jgi:hypothetical protein
MNKGKKGLHYIMANSYIQLLATVIYLYNIPYRQLEGFTHSLHSLVPSLPSADYSGLRRHILSLPVDPYHGFRETDEPVSIADSTGISVKKVGAGSRGSTAKRNAM